MKNTRQSDTKTQNAAIFLAQLAVFTYPTKDSIAVAIWEFVRRDTVTVVNLCALVNDGQHLFFLYECCMGILFFFVVAVGRVLLQRYRRSRKGSLFFGEVKIRNSHNKTSASCQATDSPTCWEIPLQFE